jgi:5'-nucleotidase
MTEAASSRETVPGPMPEAEGSGPLVVAITSRALFHLEDSNEVFEREGLAAYAALQREKEDEPLEPGVAFPLVRKLLHLNELGAPAPSPRVEVVLLSRNSSDTGLRIFNSIEHHGLRIRHAVFTSGAPVWRYIRPFGAQLFLSANPLSVRSALDHGVAAATILPAPAPAEVDPQLRIAFDGDAVIFGDESERINLEEGLEAFSSNEARLAEQPLSGGPFRPFLAALHRLQAAFPESDSPIRTALVTARSAPAHKRVILTLRRWGVRLDEALFLGGRPKGPFLKVFRADIFFDDSMHNIESARAHVAAGHVPHGVSNRPR